MVGTEETDQEASARPRRWTKRLAIIFAAIASLIVLGLIAFFVYASIYYHDLDTENVYQISTTEIPVTQGSNYLAFGDTDSDSALVFYPGAKIEYSAYSPLMRELAAKGHLCVVVEMPFNFAFLDSDAARDVMNQFPLVSRWWIGGHSLGGAMAADYVAAHPSEFEGLLLLGSYSASDLSATDLSVYSIYGSNDLVLNMDSLVTSRGFMPNEYSEQIIEGGNHAYFGNYGEQEGDGKATISAQEQQVQTAQIANEAMKG